MLAHDVVRTYGDRRVLDGVSLTAAPGQRIGLIGENGVGKSTLLKVLAGADEPDAGRVERPVDVGFLPQEIVFDEETTFADILDEALADARAVLAELDRLGDALGESPDDPAVLDPYSALLDHAQRHEVWDADRRADIVLAGLGLADAPRERRLATLSGGQRSRLTLAALMVRRPSALLLDEPTNHLDDEASTFLAAHLAAMPGVVILSSHDRAFLDAVCTDLIDLDPAVDGPTRYGGNYTAYLAQKRADLARWQRRFDEEQEGLEALRVAASVTAHEVAPNKIKQDNEKMGYGHAAGRVQSQISRRVRNATRRLDKLEREQVDEPPKPLRFNPGTFATDESDEPVLTLRDVEVSGRVAVEHLDIGPVERLLVTGINGAGKSTLLGVLADTQAHTGTVVRRPELTVGLLSQDTTFERADRTAREIYEAALGAELAESVPLDSLGLLTAWDQERAVGLLSVGQRRRLGLALLMARPPALLLLDEPTNHLSPRLCDELEEAMGSGPGAIVVASHDRWLRSRWQGRELRLT